MSKQNLGIRDGFTITFHTEPDCHSTPFDADCYSADDITAWRQDEWHYRGLIVEASRGGVILGDASIWGVEDGQLADVYADADDITAGAAEYYLADLTDEAIDNAKRTVETVIAAAG